MTPPDVAPIIKTKPTIACSKELISMSRSYLTNAGIADILVGTYNASKLASAKVIT